MLYPKPKRVHFKPKKRRNPDMQTDCIQRDGRCMVCGVQDNTLIGHHIQTWGSSGIDELYNMITLCYRCHEEAERGHISAEQLGSILKREYGYLPV